MTDPFNFDSPPDRRKADSAMWNKFGNRDVLPMWVASMHFRSAPGILDALRQRVDEGVFDYASPRPSTIDAAREWFFTQYQWKLEDPWITWLPGGVVGLNAASRAFAKEGEEGLTFGPAYPPFTEAPKRSGRIVRRVPLALNTTAHRWEIDWDALETSVSPSTRFFILCHPYNPIGRVWERAELARLVDFCARHRLVLISDEVHSGLVLNPEMPHVPTADLSDQARDLTVTLTGPSKTFNLQLSTTVAIVANQALRKRLSEAAQYISGYVNAIGYTTCEAAYRTGEPWRLAMLEYLRGNRDLLIETVERDLPGIKIEAPIDATYLAWLNVAELGLPDPVAHFEKHGVGFMDGELFGEIKGKYVRMNFACPRSMLREALTRMATAIKARSA
jgi:cystathionine beta-lyase